MLDNRKATILRAVVEAYIDGAQPVGSSRIAEATGLNVSAATVRNEMAALEKEGYLVQPHTSAGRIPTDKGYRFFVDQLAGPGELQPQQRQQVRDFFDRAHGEVEQMLHDTSRLLANLTESAAVVIGPPHETATLRSVQLVTLSSRTALLVVVLASGVVEKQLIELEQELDETSIAKINDHLAAQLYGKNVGELKALPTLGNAELDDLAERCRKAIDQIHQGEPEWTFVGGASQMAGSFEGVETVRKVLGILEQQYVVISLLRHVLDQGLSVAIGKEHGMESLAECSVVVAPYPIEGKFRGTVGILGPTRMNYPQALAAVRVVGNRLGERLSEG